MHDDDEVHDDGEEDPEAPGPDDVDENDDDMGTMECPYCKAEIADEAEWCPHCGKYISKEDAPSSRKLLWTFVAILLIALILFAWVF